MALIRPPHKQAPIYARPRTQSTPTQTGDLGSITDIAAETGASRQNPAKGPLNEAVTNTPIPSSQPSPAVQAAVAPTPIPSAPTGASRQATRDARRAARAARRQAARAARRAARAARRRRLVLDGGIAQNLTFARKHGTSVTLSNGGLTMVGSTGNWFYACPGAAEDSDSSKLRADGGQWMYEVTIDNIPSTNAYCSIGFGNDNTAQFDTVVCGNGNGCALLVDDQNGTLSRLYYGSSPSTFQNASNPSFPLDAGGTVVTMGIDLDNDTVSAYMDGELVHSRAYSLNGAEDDRIIPVVKSMWGPQMTLNTTVQYPIDGYTVWK